MSSYDPVRFPLMIVKFIPFKAPPVFIHEGADQGLEKSFRSFPAYDCASFIVGIYEIMFLLTAVNLTFRS